MASKFAQYIFSFYIFKKNIYTYIYLLFVKKNEIILYEKVQYIKQNQNKKKTGEFQWGKKIHRIKYFRNFK